MIDLFILFIGFLSITFLLVCLVQPALFTLGCRLLKVGRDIPFKKYFKTGLNVVLANYAVVFLMFLVRNYFYHSGLKNIVLNPLVECFLFLLWIWAGHKIIGKGLGLKFGKSLLVYLGFIICVLLS